MIIHVYKRGEVEKTYTAEAYTLMFGVLEDVAELVKLDDLKTGDDTEFVKVIVGAIISSVGTVRELLLDVFPGLTADDLRRVPVEEIGTALMEIVAYTIKKLRENIGKNLQRVGAI